MNGSGTRDSTRRNDTERTDELSVHPFLLMNMQLNSNDVLVDSRGEVTRPMFRGERACARTRLGWHEPEGVRA